MLVLGCRFEGVWGESMGNSKASTYSKGYIQLSPSHVCSLFQVAELQVTGINFHFLDIHKASVKGILGKLAGGLTSLMMGTTPLSIVRHMTTLQFPRLTLLSFDAILEGYTFHNEDNTR